MKKAIVLFAMLFILSAGCSYSSSTRTETTIEHSTQKDASMQGNMGNFPGGQSYSEPRGEESTRTRRTSRIKEEKTETGSTGVIGTTFHFIGQVLAFPFKVIANVIEFIF